MVRMDDIRDPASDFYQLEPFEQLTALGPRLLTQTYFAPTQVQLVGYEGYVEQVLRAMAQSRSVLLLGPSGVGKSAILGEVAYRIATRQPIPHAVRTANIAQASTGEIMLGCRYWGDWEAKLGAIVRALNGMTGTSFLYIENIWHLHQAAVSRESSESFASFLLPFLQRNELSLLGESTEANYRGSSGHAGLVTMPELTRQFTIIDIQPPDARATRGILAARAAELRRFGKVKLTEGALDRCLELSGRFARQRAAPGNALALLAEVVAAWTPTEVDQPAQSPHAPVPDDPTAMAGARETAALKGELARLASVLERVAGMASEGHIQVSTCMPRSARTRLAAPPARRRVAVPPVMITADQTLTAVLRHLRLPALLFDDALPLDRAALRAALASKVISQHEAVDTVIDRLLCIKANLHDPDRSLGVLFLGGPTGTGKTLLAQTVAENVFGDKDALVRVDLSEYAHPGSGVLLPDQLARELERRTCAVVLLDEAEKAHPSVFDILLPVFDAARVRTAVGEPLSLHNVLFILTSNLGSDLSAMGRGTESQSLYERLAQSTRVALRDYFRPEFLNRIDSIVTFRPLGPRAMRAILKRELAVALRRDGLARRSIEVSYDDEVAGWLLTHGFDPVYGARPLKRLIASRVLVPLAEHVAAMPSKGGRVLTLKLHDEGIVVQEMAPLDREASVPRNREC